MNFQLVQLRRKTELVLGPQSMYQLSQLSTNQPALTSFRQIVESLQSLMENGFPSMSPFSLQTTMLVMFWKMYKDLSTFFSFLLGIIFDCLFMIPIAPGFPILMDGLVVPLLLSDIISTCSPVFKFVRFFLSEMHDPIQ